MFLHPTSAFGRFKMSTHKALKIYLVVTHCLQACYVYVNTKQLIIFIQRVMCCCWCVRWILSAPLFYFPKVNCLITGWIYQCCPTFLRLSQEREEKVRLQAQIKRLWEDNQRLQEESQTSAAKLKKFTEWVFNTIDMNWLRPAHFISHTHVHICIHQHTQSGWRGRGRGIDTEKKLRTRKVETCWTDVEPSDHLPLASNISG